MSALAVKIIIPEVIVDKLGEIHNSDVGNPNLFISEMAFKSFNGHCRAIICVKDLFIKH